MCRFIETIRVKDGVPVNLAYHAERMNRTRRHFWPGCKETGVHGLLPEDALPGGLQKVRVVYGEVGIETCEVEPYSIRCIRTVKVVECDGIDYAWKSTDRSLLTALRDGAKGFDEIVIVKNGCVTDTSYSNLCFYDGTAWFTPDTPLLRGTMRQRLLDRGAIREARILRSDIPYFPKFALINAMMDLGDLVLSTDCITL